MLTNGAMGESGGPSTLIFSRLHALAQLSRRMQGLHYRRQFSLNPAECQLIGIVQGLGRSSCSRICEVGSLDKAQVSRLVKRLARQGLLLASVHPKRQRTIDVTLTERGRELARLLRSATLRLNRESLSAVPPAERATFLTAMSMLTEKVRLMLHEERHATSRRGLRTKRRNRSPLAPRSDTPRRAFRRSS